MMNSYFENDAELTFEPQNLSCLNSRERIKTETVLHVKLLKCILFVHCKCPMQCTCNRQYDTHIFILQNYLHKPI